MAEKINIVFLGGDRRQYCTADMLNKAVFNIGIWGMRALDYALRDIRFFEDCDQALENCDCVVFPLPATLDGVMLNSPLLDSGDNKKLSCVLEKIKKGTTVIGGKIPDWFKESAAEKGIFVEDYYESEAFQVENAYLTAEAALSIAMNKLNKSVRDSAFALLGYGRIAKHLAALLRSIGAEVTVFARKESDLAWARAAGCKTERIDSGRDNCLLGRLGGFDVIYNTIPIRILSFPILEEIGQGTFIIDLASVPGGVDICAAKELGSNVLWATSLPGKYSPESAGMLIANRIENMFLPREIL